METTLECGQVPTERDGDPVRRSISQLLLPPGGLADVLYAGFARDTRGCDLSSEERFNFFGATPLCGFTLIFDGSCFVPGSNLGRHDSRSIAPLPKVSLSGPQTRPAMSWSPGPLHAVIIGFYPHRLDALTGLQPSEVTDKTIDVADVRSEWCCELLRAAHATGDAKLAYALICNGLEQNQVSDTIGISSSSRRLKDWSRMLAIRAAQSGVGRSARQVQRRFQTLTGQSNRDLSKLVRADNAFQIAVQSFHDDGSSIADIASQAGYSDQAHMSRDVRDQTGFSPADLMRRIETEEPFWCYRLAAQL